MIFVKILLIILKEKIYNEEASMTTEQIAYKLLKSGVLENPEEYTIRDLFSIRDNLEMLDSYGLADKDLLLEVKLFIEQKARG